MAAGNRFHVRASKRSPSFLPLRRRRRRHFFAIRGFPQRKDSLVCTSHGSLCVVTLLYAERRPDLVAHHSAPKSVCVSVGGVVGTDQ